MNQQNYPMTEEGAKLTLTAEQEEFCKVVYKKSTESDIYVFAGFWNPEQNLSEEEYWVLPLRSSFECVVCYPARQVFANIVGSKNDPKPSGTNSWRELLENNGIACNSCVTDGYYYDPIDHSGKTFFLDCECDSSSMVGGHVVADFDNTSPDSGSDGVYLIPICAKHNTQQINNAQGLSATGAYYYMMAAQNGKAIKLKNYLKK